MTTAGARVLVAPTAFKGTIGARDAAAALAAGVRDALADADVVELPVSDGGPGLIDALLAVRGGELSTTPVHDPFGRPVGARILLLELEDGPAAIVESADACGLHLVGGAELDPMRASTGGVGELIEAAARLADTVVVGLGGSATVDGGIGMARALGWRLTDDAGRDLEPGGAALRRLAHLRAPYAHAAPRGIGPAARALPRVVALADVRNPLVGREGAARVFGPQKGAALRDVELLEAGLSRLAEVVRRDVGSDVAALPGAGAAGGLGAGCVAFLGAQLVRGSEWLLGAVGFDAQLARAALVVTGEGSWDAQSSMGKVTGEVVARAGAAGVPVLLVAGRVEGGAPAHVTAIAGGRLDVDALARIGAREAPRLVADLQTPE